MTGTTHFTVREAIQPRATYRIQSSSRLVSGIITTSVYDTVAFTNAFLLTDVSQVSGTNTVLSTELQVSPDNVNWFSLTSSIPRTVAGKDYQVLTSGKYLSDYAKFNISVVTSGGCWTQIDSVFVR